MTGLWAGRHHNRPVHSSYNNSGGVLHAGLWRGAPRIGGGCSRYEGRSRSSGVSGAGLGVQ